MIRKEIEVCDCSDWQYSFVALLLWPVLLIVGDFVMSMSEGFVVVRKEKSLIVKSVKCLLLEAFKKHFMFQGAELFLVCEGRISLLE